MSGSAQYVPPHRRAHAASIANERLSAPSSLRCPSASSPSTAMASIRDAQLSAPAMVSGGSAKYSSLEPVPQNIRARAASTAIELSSPPSLLPISSPSADFSILDMLPRWVQNQKKCSWKEWDQAQRSLGTYDDWKRKEQEQKAVKRQIRSLPEQTKLCRDMYLAPRLQHAEAVAFHSASGLLWRETRGRCEFLMAYERTPTKSGPKESEECFNFLGGKRDRLSEGAEDVMCREVAEETRGHLSLAPAVSSAVIWDYVAKQAIFIRELSPEEQVVVRTSFQLIIADSGNVDARVTVQVEDLVAAVQDHGVPPEYTRGLYEEAGAPPECLLTIAWINMDQLAHVPVKWYVKPIIDLLLLHDETKSSRQLKDLTKQLRSYVPKLHDKLNCARSL